jgi:hypothetical protein
MTDFVLEQETKFNQWEKTFDSSTSFWKCIKYAKFLKQPLKLEMFVPLDEDGNVLECPIYNTEHSDSCYCNSCEKQTIRYYELYKKYTQAKRKVLFEGIDLDTAKYHCNRNVRTIEYFTSFNVKLTPNAIKQLGL